MMGNFRIRALSFMAAVTAVATVLCCAPGVARADGLSLPTCDMSAYTMTVGMVFCFKQDLNSSVQGFLGAMASGLSSYLVTAIALALVLFGVRIITFGSQNLLKEAAGLLFKIGIAAYIFYNAGTLYTSLSGILSELIGWVSQGFASVSASCASTASGSSPGLELPAEYQVWKAFDCMFATMFGAVTDPNAIFSSMIIIVMAAFFTGTMGIVAGIFGLTAFLTAIFMLMRALFMVLLAYLTIAFMMVLAPLFAPLLIFSSHNPQSYTKQVFERWYGIIMGALIEPMFVIGFLSMAVPIIDTFIDGPPGGATSGAATNCASLTPQNGGNGTATGVAGSGGGDVCAFLKLFPKQNYTKTLEPNGILLSSAAMMADPQSLSSDGQPIKNLWTWLQAKRTAVVNSVHQMIAAAANLQIQLPGRLRPSAPVGALAMTLITFSLVALLMFDMLKDIAKIGRRISGSVGVALYENAQVPLQQAIMGGGGGKEGLLGAFGRGAKGASKGYGMLGMSTDGLNSLPRAAIGGLSSVRDYITKNL